ncbi:NUDIX hydrolase [Amaricoccus sp.]|uniref:NUDIX hydrolase n=1 Tax=Amaricoccus sp. TaxID=1872485 RepID=UPI001B7671E9|nr:NUDIX hydrolase [Amaricoccus sp.]MBP7000824.1 NUDIX hydrolase [Amaricoccus sp.]
MAKKPSDKRKRSALAATQAPGRPAKLQVGALCWRRSGAGVTKVLLITSRDTGRWVIPKGWPMRRRTEAEAAAREAYEEAGVNGETGPSIGLFGYDKNLGHGRRIFCVVRVFPLEVRKMERKYPEFGQRRVKWFPAQKAAERVEELELAAMIREFGAALDAGGGAVTEGDAAPAPADVPEETAEG